MIRYVVKRVLLAILTVFIISAITFFAMNAIPGGPFDAEKAPSPEVKAVLEARYNLDKPVPEQYVLYLQNILQGDWGVSLKTGRDITTTLTSASACPPPSASKPRRCPSCWVWCWAALRH